MRTIYTYTGNQIGTVFSSLLAGYILEDTDLQWPTVFYLFGFLAILWYIAWLLLCYNDPASHPFISNVEKALLRKKLGHLKRNRVSVKPCTHLRTRQLANLPRTKQGYVLNSPLCTFKFETSLNCQKCVKNTNKRLKTASNVLLMPYCMEICDLPENMNSYTQICVDLFVYRIYLVFLGNECFCPCHCGGS